MSSKRKYSYQEAIDLVLQNDKNLTKAADELCASFTPNVQTPKAIEKISVTIENVRAKLGRLQRDMKARKFRHNPGLLDETFLSASQYSCFAHNNPKLLMMIMTFQVKTLFHRPVKNFYMHCQISLHQQKVT